MCVYVCVCVAGVDKLVIDCGHTNYANLLRTLFVFVMCTCASASASASASACARVRVRVHEHVYVRVHSHVFADIHLFVSFLRRSFQIITSLRW